MRCLLTKTLFLIILLAGLCPLFGQHKTINNLPFNSRPSDPYSARTADSLFQLAQEYNRAAGYQRMLRANSLPANQQRYPAKAGSKPAILPEMNYSRMAAPGENATNQVCYVISGRDYLKQDSLILWTGDPSLTADGNILVSGQFADYSTTPMNSGAFCMKTTKDGDKIWAKLYDSVGNTAPEYMNLYKSLELHDGNILLAGRGTNEISRNDDLILMKTDASGNMIWLKTYASRFWQGFHGSGDLFYLNDLKEDPVTGDIYFSGSHWGGLCAITKINPANGSVTWSRGYNIWHSDYSFGLVINPSNLLFFTMHYDSYNLEYINVYSINKNNGDTISGKHWTQTGSLTDPRMYLASQVQKTQNGHYLLTGPTTRYSQYPVYDSTQDLYHAAVVELDENLNYVKAYGFKNRIESNGYNTKVSLFPDGTGMFTMLRYISGYKGDVQIALFKNDTIYHKRRRIYMNEGIPYEPRSLPLGDGGSLNLKLSGDSTQNGSLCRIDYYRIHSADTASVCMGMPDPSTNLWYYNFEPTIGSHMDSVINNVFSMGRVKTYTAFDFGTRRDPGCTIVSNCDSLHLSITPAIICAGTPALLRIYKNKGCGSQVPLQYDTSSIGPVSYVNDSTLLIQFNNTGNYTISGSLLGCQLIKDSVQVTVLPSRGPVNIGPDTTICPANTIILNAQSGYASYLWQDGSTDSVFNVVQPGLYYVTVSDACGNLSADTVNVMPHLPVYISLGPDRSVCRGDTLQISAPPGFLSYAWQPNYNISSQTGQHVVVMPLVDTSYTIQAESEPGCYAFDTVRITVKTVAPINLGPDTRFCAGDSLNLNAGNGFVQYNWSTGASTQQVVVHSAGSYWVTGTNANGCTSKDTITIGPQYALPVVNLGNDTPLCTGNSRLLDAGGGYTLYQWNTGSTAQNISVNSPGTYSVQVVDANGCKSSDTTRVTQLLPLPAAFLQSDTAICNYGSTALTPLASYPQYLWSTGSRQASISITQPGLYWLQVTDQNNCTGRDSILVTLKECMRGVYVPAAFTPDNNGRNDLFRPLVFGDLAKYEFVVYDRAGQVLFRSTTPGRGWDGRFNGVPLSSGVYVWICHYQLSGETASMQKGTVLLMR